ncbi:hypothetical protein [Bacteroides sp. 519]|uniref:hypothetical protein n=1 Tax=Bacteroides sp. 519 TaxID=2302937 RepID=UPI0013D46D86|nr:hypothetical protein [Bacteroides sp. 519]NDV56917.1 hypothetical protein [Bacteroides sp. 519]
MLNKRTLYVIYLLHKADELCLNAGNPFHSKSNLSSPAYLDLIRIRSYLRSLIKNNLDDEALLDILLCMRRVIDAMRIPRSLKSNFPRTLSQFNSLYSHWLPDVKSSHLNDK